MSKIEQTLLLSCWGSQSWLLGSTTSPLRLLNKSLLSSPSDSSRFGQVSSHNFYIDSAEDHLPLSQAVLLGSDHCGVHSTAMLGSSKTPLLNSKCCRCWTGIETWASLDRCELPLQSCFRNSSSASESGSSVLFTPSSRENTLLGCFEVLTQVARWWEAFQRQMIVVDILSASKPMMTSYYKMLHKLFHQHTFRPFILACTTTVALSPSTWSSFSSIAAPLELSLEWYKVQQ